jgi:histidyl-tRNA synthetase
MNLQPVKGMRDFYPDEMACRNWLFGKFRDTARRFAFQEYDSCVLEHEEIYIRKGGEEITGQLYGFEDKGGRRVALRPEMTPSLARMYMARQGEFPGVLRWFSLPQCFRYERMQKGRKREHFQWNMDIIGDAGMGAELELLAALADFFSSVGLSSSDVKIRINNRRLLFDVLEKGGLPEEQFTTVSVILDKLDKIGEEEVRKLLQAEGVSTEVVSQLMAFVSAPDLDSMEERLGYVPGHAAEIRQLMAMAGNWGIADWLVFTPSLVRGLAYYTGTVFEAFDATGSNRAICGGGRYDRLIETFGGQPTPMVGFGFGDVVISLILEEKGLFPAGDTLPKILLASFSGAEDATAIAAARQLRAAGHTCELDVNHARMKKVIQRAARGAFTHLVYAGPEEVAAGTLMVKSLKTGEQQNQALSDLIERLV